MSELFSLLQLPFIQRALLVGVLLSILMSIMGVLTLVRKAAFYGDAIAHSSLAGVAIGLWLGWYPLFTAILYAIGLALALPWLRRVIRLPLDNMLGILLPTSMGLGVVLFSLLPGFQPDMMSFLFGSLITIRAVDVWLVLSLFVVSVMIFWKFLPRLLLISLDEEYAQVLKLKSIWLERLYEILLVVTIIAGVKLLGVVLVNALLIIPASSAKLLATSLRSWLELTVLLSLCLVIGGMGLSLVLNVPPGATMAVSAGIGFAVIGVISQFSHLFQEKNQRS